MKLILFVLGLFAGTVVMAQQTYNLKVIIRNFESTAGKVRVGLYEGKENYMNKAIAGKDTLIYDQKEVEVLFTEIPEGNYAFSLYHDENENGELDTNFMGIPTEDYAFSNNADGTFGPPDYEKCAFDFSADMTQTITIN